MQSVNSVSYLLQIEGGGGGEFWIFNFEVLSKNVYNPKENVNLNLWFI